MNRFRALIRVTLLGLGLVLIAQVTNAYAKRLIVSYADTGLFLEMNSEQAGRAFGHSKLGQSTGSVLEILVRLPAAEICQRLGDQASVFGANLFLVHPWLISEITSSIREITGIRPEIWAAICLLTSVLIGLVFAVRVAIQFSVNKIMIALFLAAVLVFPVLTQSMSGQAYFDRLMFGPAVVLTLSIFRLNTIGIGSIWPPVLSVLVLVLISERGAILAGLLGCGYVILLFGKRTFGDTKARVVFGAGAVAAIYAVIYLKFIATFATGGTSLDLIQLRLANLLNDPRDLFILLWILSPLLVLSIFGGRTLILVVTSLLPNVLVSIGGAELTGFYTHYHQFYLPVVVAGALIGVIRIGEWFRQRSLRFGIQAFHGITVILIGIAPAFTWTLAESAGHIDDVFQDAQRAWIPFLDREALSAQDVKRIELQNALLSVPISNSSEVSAPEALYPMLYLLGVTNISYWPMGVGNSEFVIAPITNNQTLVYPYGDIWGKEEELSDCVDSILMAKYEVVSDERMEELGYRVLRRLRSGVD